MHRNVSILIIILAVVLVSAYLVWLRGRFMTSNFSENIIPTPTVQILTPVVSRAATASATPAEASPTAKITPKITPKSKSATSSGSR